MRINSKFKDYYDSIVHTKGIDNNIIYNRVEENITVKSINEYLKNYNKNLLFNIERSNYSRETQNTIYQFYIGFCGKIYTGAIITEKGNSFIIYDINEISKYYYLFSLNQRWSDKKAISKIVAKKISLHNEFINDKNILDIFTKYNTPCFCLFYNIYDKMNYEKNTIINFELDKIQFYKCIDPYTAFQEIEIFLGERLNNGKNVDIPLTDKDKIINHGFDLKTSFRNIK
jgi:hypothetical protein